MPQLTPFYSPSGEFLVRSRVHSDVSKELEWHPPLAYLFPEDRYDHPDPPRSPTPIDFFHPPTPPMSADNSVPIPTLAELPSPDLAHTGGTSSPALLDPTIPALAGPEPSHPIWIFDSSLREVDFDVTCLNALDEQLLHSPKDCFLDICWAEAVYDEVEVPVPQPEPQAMRVRTGRKDDAPPRRLDPVTVRAERKPVSIPYCFRVVAARLTTGLQSPLSSSSYTALSPPRTVLEQSESRMLYQNANHSVHFFPVSQQRPKPSDPHAAEGLPDVRPRKSSKKLQILSNKYDSLTGRRRIASHA